MPADRHLCAVNHVEIQAPPGLEEELCWFYGELAGLEPVSDNRETSEPVSDNRETTEPVDAPTVLRFRSDRLELRVTILDNPSIDPVDCRVHLLVPSLEQAAELLDDRKHPYERHRGLGFTDRALLLLDPAGNRVMIRRFWPTGRW